MSGLAVRNKNGEMVHYTGSRFEGLENVGTHHLCVRTGSGADSVKKYALTSAPLNDKYKGLKMRIPDNAGGDGGREAYIAQRYSVSESVSSSEAYTTSRASNYVSSTTLKTASSTRLSTANVTRVSTHAPIYYGSSPIKSTTTTRNVFGGGTYTRTVNVEGRLLSYSSGTSIYTQITAYANASISKSDTLWNLATVVMTITRGAYSVTRTQTSRVSNYVSSRTLSTASSSKLSTGNATRSSAYNTSRSMSTTSSKLTHNANL